MLDQTNPPFGGLPVKPAEIRGGEKQRLSLSHRPPAPLLENEEFLEPPC